MKNNFKLNENEIKEMYFKNLYNIILFEKNKKYHIKNNITFKENVFNINNISLKNYIDIYNYLYENYKIEIINIYSYIDNLNNFKNVNRYNYENIINYYFNLIFDYDLFKLINLFYYHITNNNIYFS